MSEDGLSGRGKGYRMAVSCSSNELRGSVGLGSGDFTVLSPIFLYKALTYPAHDGEEPARKMEGEGTQ